MDIVERLRKNCTCNFESTPCGAEEECQNAFDGADEIERLRKILEDVLETSGEQIPYGTVKAIRTALKEKE